MYKGQCTYPSKCMASQHPSYAPVHFSYCTFFLFWQSMSDCQVPSEVYWNMWCNITMCTQKETSLTGICYWFVSFWCSVSAFFPKHACCAVTLIISFIYQYCSPLVSMPSASPFLIAKAQQLQTAVQLKLYALKNCTRVRRTSIVLFFLSFKPRSWESSLAAWRVDLLRVPSSTSWHWKGRQTQGQSAGAHSTEQCPPVPRSYLGRRNFSLAAHWEPSRLPAAPWPFHAQAHGVPGPASSPILSLPRVQSSRTMAVGGALGTCDVKWRAF